MIYFTSDWHLDHANIIRYSNRPFKNVEDMNSCIIENMNSVAKPEEDDIIFLGDFAFSKDIHRIKQLRQAVKCDNFYFVFGNHDKLLRKYRNNHSLGFVFWGDYAEEDFIVGRGEKKSITLTHYAMRVWNKCHYGSWHLYGHSHGTLPDDPNSCSFDVGVDTNNFKPYSLNDIERIMKTKNFKPIDHHETRNN